VSAQIVVGPQRIVHVLAAMRGGKGHPHNAAHIARGQPSLLVVVRPVQLPALVLKKEKIQLNRRISTAGDSCLLAGRLSSRQLRVKCPLLACKMDYRRLKARPWPIHTFSISIYISQHRQPAGWLGKYAPLCDWISILHALSRSTCQLPLSQPGAGHFHSIPLDS